MAANSQATKDRQSRQTKSMKSLLVPERVGKRGGSISSALCGSGGASSSREARALQCALGADAIGKSDQKVNPTRCCTLLIDIFCCGARAKFWSKA